MHAVTCKHFSLCAPLLFSFLMHFEFKSISLLLWGYCSSLSVRCVGVDQTHKSVSILTLKQWNRKRPYYITRRSGSKPHLTHSYTFQSFFMGQQTAWPETHRMFTQQQVDELHEEYNWVMDEPQKFMCIQCNRYNVQEDMTHINSSSSLR